MLSLTGSGTAALTSGTTKLYVAVDTPDPNSTWGDANPVNRYHVGLLRLGDGTGFYDPIPVLDGPQIILVPSDVVEVSYAVRGTSVVQVTEYPPVTPGGSLMGSFTPAGFFTATADYALGMFFYVDAASTLTDIGIYCPTGESANLSGQPIGVYRMTGPTLLWSGTIPTLVNGWNHWGIPPVSLVTSENYVLEYVALTGTTTVADGGYSPPTIIAGHCHLGELSGTWTGADEPGNVLAYPSMNDTNWIGQDVITTTP